MKSVYILVFVTNRFTKMNKKEKSLNGVITASEHEPHDGQRDSCEPASQLFVVSPIWTEDTGAASNFLPCGAAASTSLVQCLAKVIR